MKKNSPSSFPVLYTKNSDGSINQWEISVSQNTILTKYGRVGGAVQEARDTVTDGKNIGKKNETSPEEQARKEAKSRWTKQKKLGYVENIDDAKADKVDEIIEGGIDPMLAQKWRDHAKKMKFPAAGQPKLDGIRCIAIIKNGRCTLWTRTRKPIRSVPHVVAALEKQFVGGNAIIDGELYNHELKSDFEKIVSMVRSDEPQTGCEIVQYHIYDTVSGPSHGAGFTKRTTWLHNTIRPNDTLKLVETVMLAKAEDVEEYLAECLDAGYEGCMVRSTEGTYENKRSYGLLKVKEFEDDEFEIVGVEEGRGKMAGKAIFVCKTKKGDTFNAKLKGKLDNLAKYLNNKKVIGKNLTVRYQGYTNGNVPRFPVGIIVRDYE